MSVFIDKELKEIETANAERIERMEQLTGKAKAEDRNFSKTELSEFEKLSAETEKAQERAEYLKSKTPKKTSRKLEVGAPNIISRGDNMSEYSLLRLIQHQAAPLLQKEGRNVPDAGFELEIGQEIERRAKESGVIENTGQGVWVPMKALTRDLTYSGDGSELVPEEHLASQMIDVLRNSSQVMSLKPTMLTDLKGNVDIPKKDGSSTAYWVTGDGGSITTSDLSFTSVSMEPHFVAARTGYTYRTLIQSSPGIEQIVRKDLADTLGVEIDRAAIDGTGSSNQPKGILNYSGINAFNTSANTGPTWAEIVQMEEELLNDNALAGNRGYLIDSGQLKYLKSTDKGTDTGQFLMSDNNNLNGYPARFTKNMPTDYYLFGNWSELLVGMWGAVRLMVDPYTNFDTGSVQVRAILPIDFNLRHEKSFCRMRITAS